MPVYKFKCKKCGNRFELAESISQHDKHKEQCPECGSGIFHPVSPDESDGTASPTRPRVTSICALEWAEKNKATTQSDPSRERGAGL